MSHAHSVGLDQNVVRQEIFLVEPQIGHQIIFRGRQIANLTEKAIEGTGKGKAQHRSFLGLGESAIPMDVTPIRGKQAALEEARRFVIKSDFLVRYRPVTHPIEGQSKNARWQSAYLRRKAVSSMCQVAPE